MTDVLIGFILITMGIQFGVALTATLIVHPILVTTKKTTAIEFFKPFFDKTHIMVFILSIFVTILALIYSLFSGDLWWFATSLLLFLNIPYTMIFIMPLNRRLMNENVNPFSKQTENDLNKWGKLHLARTLLNGIIFLAFIILTVFKM